MDFDEWNETIAILKSADWKCENIDLLGIKHNIYY